MHIDRVCRDQLLFSLAGVLFYGILAPHGVRAVRQGFNIDQPNRSVLARIFRSAPKVMLFCAPLWVGCPPCVKGAVGAFDDVTEVSHRCPELFFGLIHIPESTPAGEQFSEPLPGSWQLRGGNMFPIVGLPFTDP